MSEQKEQLAVVESQFRKQSYLLVKINAETEQFISASTYQGNGNWDKPIKRSRGSIVRYLGDFNDWRPETIESFKQKLKEISESYWTNVHRLDRQVRDKILGLGE